MSSQITIPEGHRDNLLQSLIDEVGRYAEEEGVRLSKAFSHLALGWIGDQDSIESITDGAADRGLDAYQISPESVTLYQFKARETLDKEQLDAPGGSELLSDIHRIINLLNVDELPEGTSNASLRRFINSLRTHVRMHSAADEIQKENHEPPIDGTLLINIKLVALTNGLTRQAAEELDKLRKANDIIKVFGVDALLDVTLVTLNELLTTRWRESNTDWKDINGQKSDTIKLTVEGQRIEDKSSMIFYTKAVDLIDAFNRFGYQLFEPNVRCSISNSRVNREISKQVETEKGIRQFKYLNNGVTIVHSSCSKRGDHVTFSRPGIVNGLQTVTTLAAKYSTLPSNIRAYFDEHCHVLVRVYGKSDIFVPTLVKATNNQNPMEPRNLRSNDSEQILLEQRFAELGWFYERKDYAWEAFISDEGAWPTLKGANRKTFQVMTGQGGRPLVRRVDNQDAAQAWLAFTGYANEAVQHKRELFTNDRFYDHAFKSRPFQHGYTHDFSFAEGRKEGAISLQAPLAEALLLGHLCTRLANALTPGMRHHREASIARLRLIGRKKEEQDSALNDDAEWLAGLIRISASMLFAEMCGMVLFRAFGDQFYKAVPGILNKTDMVHLFKNLSADPIRAVVDAQAPNPGENSLFSLLWLTHVYLTNSIAADMSWRNSFFQASSRPRYLYSAPMRRLLQQYVQNFDNRLKGVGMPLNWTDALEKKGGLFAYVQSLPVL